MQYTGPASARACHPDVPSGSLRVHIAVLCMFNLRTRTGASNHHHHRISPEEQQTDYSLFLTRNLLLTYELSYSLCIPDTRIDMDESYDVIVLGTGLKVMQIVIYS